MASGCRHRRILTLTAKTARDRDFADPIEIFLCASRSWYPWRAAGRGIHCIRHYGHSEWHYTGNMTLFHIVFCVVLFSIAIQGTLLPLVCVRRTEMLDTSGKHSDHHFPITAKKLMSRFIDIPVTEHHPWNGMKVRSAAPHLVHF